MAGKGSDRKRGSDIRRIVVGGEFNSGKTSVINLLLRREVMVASADYSNLPPVRIVHADKPTCTITKTNGKSVKAATFGAGKIDGAEIAEVEIGTDLGPLGDATITEVSVEPDGTLSAEGRALMETADLLIWCTMGQRAWALTEITIVKSLPDRIHQNAILAMTRADYLRGDDSRDLVKRRLDKQASAYFPTILQVACSRKAIDEAQNDASWRENGGQGLMEAVLNSLDGPPAQDANQPENIFAAGAKARVEDAEPAPSAVVREWKAEIDAFEAWIGEAVNPTAEEVVHRLNALLQRIATAEHAGVASGLGLDGLDTRFDFARNHVQTTLGRHVTERDALSCVDLVLQLEQEVFHAGGRVPVDAAPGRAARDEYRVS